MYEKVTYNGQVTQNNERKFELKRIKNNKKGIYVIPGLLGSRLYDDSGREIWVDWPIAGDVLAYNAFGNDASVMGQNSDGTGVRVQANKNKDLFGTLNNYQPLLDGLRTMLQEKSLEQMYDLNFFPYNWLDDLQNAVKNLEKDIAAKGYDKVILIGHSMGGVLSAAFISSSSANKAKIEKAILLGAPLLGTYAALQPIETGTTTFFNGKMDTVLTEILNSLVLKPFFNGYMRNISKNSPGFYQLMPSKEYLESIPMKYNSGEVSDINGYYQVLKKSSKVNHKLLTESVRSHKQLREKIFVNGIVNHLSQVDTVLIGTASGYITPTNASYKRQLITGNSIYDEIIYTKNGDSTVAGISALLDGKIPFLNFENVTHGGLATDPAVLAQIYRLVRGETVKYSTTVPKTDMSNLIKLTLDHSVDVNTIILDKDNKTIATYKEGISDGFDGKDFLYVTEQHEDIIKDHIFIPESGYKVKFVLNSEMQRRSRKPFHLSAGQLDEGGIKIAEQDYSSTYVNNDGVIFELDLTGDMESDN